MRRVIFGGLYTTAQLRILVQNTRIQLLTSFSVSVCLSDDTCVLFSFACCALVVRVWYGCFCVFTFNCYVAHSHINSTRVSFLPFLLARPLRNSFLTSSPLARARSLAFLCSHSLVAQHNNKKHKNPLDTFRSSWSTMHRRHHLHHLTIIIVCVCVLCAAETTVTASTHLYDERQCSHTGMRSAFPRHADDDIVGCCVCDSNGGDRQQPSAADALDRWRCWKWCCCAGQWWR